MAPRRPAGDPGDPNLAQDATRQAPMTPKELPRDFKMAQHGTKKAQRRPQGSPIWPIPGSRWLQARSKDAQRGSKEGPRWPKMTTRWPQEAPKKAQDGPKRVQGCPQMRKELPRKPNIGQQNTLKNCRKIESLGPRGPPGEPNMAQDGSKMSLRSPKKAQREARGGPKRLQGALKTLRIPAGGLTSQKC